MGTEAVVWFFKKIAYRTRSYLDHTIIIYTAASDSETRNMSYEDCFSRIIFTAMYIDQISAQTLDVTTIRQQFGQEYEAYKIHTKKKTTSNIHMHCRYVLHVKFSSRS